MSDGGATLLIAVVMVIGLAGTVVPILPGLIVMWVGGLVYGLLVGFGPVGLAVMVGFTAIVGVSIVLSVVLPRRMAVGSGVGLWSQLAALAGAIVGFFVVPVVGVVLGALVGLFLAELAQQQRLAPAWAGTKAVAVAFGLSALIDVALGLVMFTLWGLWALTVM